MKNKKIPLTEGKIVFWGLIAFFGGFFVFCKADASEIVAATLILEAGGEYSTGSMEAVNEVIRNRAAKRKLTPRQVCLQRKQFSCWNSGKIDQLLAKAKRHPRFNKAMAIANGVTTNYTGGARNYHADYVNPYWASSMKKTCTIGKHIYYK